MVALSQLCMKAMSNFRKYKVGIITMEIQSLMPEKFINLLWNKGIVVKNIRKVNITTVVLDVKLSDYGELIKISKQMDVRIEIIGRKGISFFLIKVRRRFALLFGVLLFGGIIYYLSSFIWNIDISTEHYISPYELRSEIKSLGVRPGLKKKDVDVYNIENMIARNNDEIMWIKVRVEGVKLKVDIIERQSPPIISINQTPGNLVAGKDGIVVRVYTTEGTAIVKDGDIVQKGDLLVKGEQGKEGSVYPVRANGEVVAKTFYEEIKEVPLCNISKTRTGKNITNIYIKLANKKIYLKNSLIPYSNYDKIDSKESFITKETYYEVEEKTIPVDVVKITEEIYSNILRDLDKTVKVIDKISDIKKESDKYLIKALIVAEENIALEEN